MGPFRQYFQLLCILFFRAKLWKFLDKSQNFLIFSFFLPIPLVIHQDLIIGMDLKILSFDYLWLISIHISIHSLIFEIIWKAGRFARVSLPGYSQRIVTRCFRVSRAQSHHSPAFLNLHGLLIFELYKKSLSYSIQTSLTGPGTGTTEFRPISKDLVFLLLL